MTAKVAKEVTVREEQVYNLEGLTLNHLHALNIVWKEWAKNHSEDWTYIGREVRRLMREMALAINPDQERNPEWNA